MKSFPSPSLDFDLHLSHLLRFFGPFKMRSFAVWLSLGSSADSVLASKLSTSISCSFFTVFQRFFFFIFYLSKSFFRLSKFCIFNLSHLQAANTTGHIGLQALLNGSRLKAGSNFEIRSSLIFGRASKMRIWPAEIIIHLLNNRFNWIVILIFKFIIVFVWKKKNERGRERQIGQRQTACKCSSDATRFASRWMRTGPEMERAGCRRDRRIRCVPFRWLRESQADQSLVLLLRSAHWLRSHMSIQSIKVWQRVLFDLFTS